MDIANSQSCVRFSPIGIILTFTFASILFVALIAIGLFNRYPAGEHAVPLRSTCSAAISAACHKPEGDVDAHLLPVRRKVTGSHDGVGHCLFTTAVDIEPPMDGMKYK